MSEALASELRERGFVVLPGVVPAAASAPIVAALAAERARGGHTPSEEGLVVRDLVRLCPSALAIALPAEVRGVLRAYLGEAIVLEALAAIVSDARRPFLRWHAHVGGVLQDAARASLGALRLEKARRAMVLFYPEGCAGDLGPLLVLPRRLGEPCAPPFDPRATDWPGAVEVHAAPGTAVIADEATYHAVRAQTRAGPRYLVGAYVAREDAATRDPTSPALATLRIDAA